MAEPATDEQIAAMRAYLKAEGSPKRWSRHAVAILIARIDKERAARETAEAQSWKIGDPRCDACDNGIVQAWSYCAWCGAALKAREVGNG